MNRYTFDKAARRWVKVDETPKKRVTRKRTTAETKEVKADNK